MKNVITSRIELLLAKIAGRDVDISTMTPPVAINLKEELLLDIADRLDSASSELPTVSTTDNGDVLKVVSGKWAKGEESKELPAVSSTDNGNVLTVVEGAWAKSAPSGGGGLLVETTFVDVSQYVKGFVSDIDADDIVEAFTSGQNVVVHFPHALGGYIPAETYVPIAVYVPADEENYVDEAIEFPTTYPSNISISWFNGVERTEAGKFFFKIYID